MIDKQEVLRIIELEYQKFKVDFAKRFPSIKPEQCTIHHILNDLRRDIDSL